MLATLKLPKRIDVAEHAFKLRNSHAAVVQGIATHAEKHRDALHAKRQKLESDKLLTSGSHNATQGV